METQKIYNKAERVRDVLRYISKFKNTLIVIHIDDDVIDSSFFSSHIRDIAYLHDAGLKVIIVPGAKKRIDTVLTSSGKIWKTQNNIRITSEDTMPEIKMAAFDVSNQIMTALAQEHLTAVIGNWVKAKAKGVINGIDYSTAGEIHKINIEAISTILNEGFIPIFPCIGWNDKGRPYNISSTTLACEVANYLQAEKLFYLTSSKGITTENFIIPESIGISDQGFLPSLSLEEVELFFEKNSTANNNSSLLQLLKLSHKACSLGVSRSHIVNGLIEGTLLCEIFSDYGSGTMIYKNNYGGLRAMVKEDIPSVINLFRPFVEEGILLQRTEQELLETFSDYTVYEIDGGIKASAALHIYDNLQGEIAAVAVDESCSNMGVGLKLIQYLLAKARTNKLSSVFILTTQTADWFEQLGFSKDTLESIPLKRREKWSKERGSKVYRLMF